MTTATATLSVRRLTLTLQEVGAELQLRPRAVAALIKAGALKGINIACGPWRAVYRVRRSDLDLFLESRAVTPPAPRVVRTRRAKSDAIEFYR